MEDNTGSSAECSRQIEYKFVSIKSPEYRLEFINGAFSNVTTRGEIICNFHLESKDMPTEQTATLVNAESRDAKLSPLQDPGTYTRDVKFGIIMTPQFARSLIILLKDKISESDDIAAPREKKGEGA